MLSSKRDRFVWSKEDWLPEKSFFRVLHQHWHPTTRVVVAEEEVATIRGRRFSHSSSRSAHRQPAKPGWTPWLWIGS